MTAEKMTDFVKNKDFLVCVDSDGCAMDTMTSKHKEAFCPCFIKTYGMETYAQIITEEWLHTNLYSASRGINRFKGLAQILGFLAEHSVDVPGRKEITDWVKDAPVLSNDALREAISMGGGDALKTALKWSISVNDTVANMKGESFPGCLDALQNAAIYADVAVVSAANSEAVFEEWNRCKLAPFMSIMLGQDAGSKASCLSALSGKGYAVSNVLMVGDALGDLDAARQAGTLFFPILVGHETECWQNLKTDAIPRLLNGTYIGEYQDNLIAQQKEILR